VETGFGMKEEVVDRDTNDTENDSGDMNTTDDISQLLRCEVE
jgi:hypothetical protein